MTWALGIVALAATGTLTYVLGRGMRVSLDWCGSKLRRLIADTFDDRVDARLAEPLAKIEQRLAVIEQRSQRVRANDFPRRR